MPSSLLLGICGRVNMAPAFSELLHASVWNSGVDAFPCSYGNNKCTSSIVKMSELTALANEPLQSTSVEACSDTSLNSISANLCGLEKRSEKAMRRIRKLQSLHGLRHCKEQMTTLVSRRQRYLQKSLNGDIGSRQTAKVADLNADLFKNEDVKNLSTSALVSLVRRMQETKNVGNQSLLNNLSVEDKMFVDNPTIDSLDKSLEFDAKCTSAVLGQEFRNLSGMLKQTLRQIQGTVDSDCTESSSGEESCDENIEIRGKSDCPLWHWSGDRSSIASRWTWLQAQVSDLEYRIRQQGDIYRQIRNNKNKVLLENLNHSNDEELAARCRPLISCGRRRLLSSVNLHASHSKAARLSTVKCHCSPLSTHDYTLLPYLSCAMCGGRYNNMQSVDDANISNMHRVALLDSSSHPILSFPRDVSMSVRIGAILKSGDVPCKKRLMSSASLDSASCLHKKSRTTKSSKSLISKTKKKSLECSTVVSTENIKGKYDGKRRNRPKPSKITSGLQSRKKRKKPGRKRAKGYRFSEILSGHSTPTGNLNDSNIFSQSCPAGTLRKRRNEAHSFDIDNIVIPYSVASSTRVEKIQYKEIVTPKWREILKINGSLSNNNYATPFVAKSLITPKSGNKNGFVAANEAVSVDGDGTVEDMSDEAFAARHLLCEVNEKKRFALATHHVRRSRVLSEADGSSGELFPSQCPSPILSSSCRTIVPWKTRSFPLNDSDCISLTQIEPLGCHSSRLNFPSRWTMDNELLKSRREVPEGALTPETDTAPASPHDGSSTSSALEDPDDPEWTVVSSPMQDKVSSLIVTLRR